MPLRSLIEVTDQLMRYGDARNLLVNDPDTFLDRFNLTPEEREAVRTCDRWALEELGLDEWTARWVSALR